MVTQEKGEELVRAGQLLGALSEAPQELDNIQRIFESSS